MVLEVDSVIKTYGNREVLNDIFLSCNTGEIIGLMGRNGEGKSTLLKVISNCIPAQNRFVSIDKKALQNPTEFSLFIHYLPQENYFPRHLKIRTLIRLTCNANSVRQLESLPPIKPFLDTRARNLSGGEVRLIEILTFLHSDAPFLLLDEPFDSLSPLYIEEVKHFIKKQAVGKGILIADQNYKDLMEITNKNYLLQQASIAEIKSEEELSKSGYLSRGDMN